MAKSSPEKLAAALRANLKRRKGPTSPKGEEDGRAAKRAPMRAVPKEPAPDKGARPPKTPSKPAD